MKLLSEELKNHISSEVTTIATLWRLIRRDNVVMGFTDFSDDIFFDDINYKAFSGFTPAAISSNSDLSVDNLEVEAVLNSEYISERDIIAGLYDFANIDILKVNYKDISQGCLVLRSGYIGEVTLKKNSFVAEIRGLSQNLSQTIGQLYSPSCRANFCDSLCGLSEENYIFSGSITSIVNNRLFFDAGRTEEKGFFSFGKILFLNGNNINMQSEIKRYSDNGLIELVLPMKFDLKVNDAYRIVTGCDKTFNTCVKKFNNALNFRGEPHIPGLSKILNMP